MNRILILSLSIVSVVCYAENSLDVSFDRIANIQEEMQFWQNQLKSVEKQKEKGNVSQAYLMTLNAILTEMSILRKQAIDLLAEINQEEQRINNEKRQAEKQQENK
jgi:stalled ribosome rescue protein Dom34